uniref:Uncharacterized protein n=1 Tax=Rhizophora mucronata TaxID=61149 RepID=A0A2P2N1Y1_RHIMU
MQIQRIFLFIISDKLQNRKAQTQKLCYFT